MRSEECTVDQWRITWSLEIVLGMQGALVMHFLGEECPGDRLYDRIGVKIPNVLHSHIKTS